MGRGMKFYSNWRIDPLYDVNIGRVHTQVDEKKFFPWFRVEIQDRQNSDGSVSKHVIFHADHYVNNAWECTFCYSADDFTDAEILRDVLPRIMEVYSGTSIFYV